MKYKSKSLIALIGVLIAVFVFTMPIFAKAQQEEKVVEITVAGSQLAAIERPMVDLAVKNFEQKYPGVKVKMNLLDSQYYVDTGVFALFTEGIKPPDVYWLQTGVYTDQFIKAGRALDLAPYLKEKCWEGDIEWQDSIVKAAIAAGSEGGKTYQIPDRSTIFDIIWYDQKVFNKVGIGEPETWNDYMTICSKLKSQDITPIVIGNNGTWPIANWASVIIQRVGGKDKIFNTFLQKNKGSFSDPDIVKTGSLLADVAKKGYFNKDITAISNGESRRLFYSTECGTVPHGEWFWSNAKEQAPEGFQYSFFDTPTVSGGKGKHLVRPVGLDGWLAYKGTEHPREAVNLLKALTSEDVATGWQKSGRTSTHVKVIKKASSLNLDSQVVKLLDYALESTGFYGAPDTSFDLQIVEYYSDAMAKIIGLVETPEVALKKAQEQTEKYLSSK